MFPASLAAPMTLQLDWPDPRLTTLWALNRLPQRLPALVEALVDTPTCLLPIERQVRTPVLGEPLRLDALLYAWPDSRSLIGLQAADGSRYRLLERDGEARQYFGPAAVYRHTVRAETLEDRPPALRFCLAHKTWPGWDAQWEERHRTALAWIERALRHLAALDHQWTARATPDAAWSYALTRNPHLVGTLRLGEGYPEFDPDQPRDGRGRWTDGGGSDDGPAAGPMRTERLGREEVSYLVDPADAEGGSGNGRSRRQQTIDAAVNWITEMAITKPTVGNCAKRVREALEASGLKLSLRGRPLSAKDYGPYLENHGFAEVSMDNYIPQKGDIVVMQPHSGSTHGHIAIYNGKNWVSDFMQRDIWAGPGYRREKPSQKIYRLNTY
ncbi:MAG TPA: hypothetical protein VED40_00765 [Azospirillaceae bacterium]|nr:hypothetical protein [Azospirillaceae bacterium]